MGNAQSVQWKNQLSCVTVVVLTGANAVAQAVTANACSVMGAEIGMHANERTQSLPHLQR